MIAYRDKMFHQGSRAPAAGVVYERPQSPVSQGNPFALLLVTT